MTDLYGRDSAVQIGTEFALTVDLGPSELPLLRVELMEDTSGGCLARFSGCLVADTVGALWSIEPMMANEARVNLDLTGVVAIDGAGLVAAMRLMDAIRTFGASLTIGCQGLSVGGAPQPIL